MPARRSLGDIVIDATINTTGMAAGARRAETALERFERQTEEARRSIDRFEASVRQVGTVLRQSFYTALAAAGSAAVFGRFVQQTAQWGEELSAAAARIGDTVEGLQRFGQALALHGGDQERAQRIAERLRSSVALAAQGYSTYARALEQFGISAEEANRLGAQPLLETIRALARGAENLNAAQIAGALGQLVGQRNLAGLQNIIQGGPAGATAAFAVTDDLRRVSTEQAERLTALNAEIFKLTNDLQIGFRQAVADSAEGLRGFAEQFRETLPSVFRELSSGLVTFTENLDRVIRLLSVLVGTRVLGSLATAGVTGAGAFVASGSVFRGIREELDRARIAGRDPRFSPTGITAFSQTVGGLAGLAGGAIAVTGVLYGLYEAGRLRLEQLREQQRQEIEGFTTIERLDEEEARLRQQRVRLEAELAASVQSAGQFDVGRSIRSILDDLESNTQAQEVVADRRLVLEERYDTFRRDQLRRERENEEARRLAAQAEIEQRRREIRERQVLINRELRGLEALGGFRVRPGPGLGTPGAFGFTQLDFDVIRRRTSTDTGAGVGESTRRIFELVRSGGEFDDSLRGLTATQRGIITTTDQMVRSMSGFINALTSGNGILESTTALLRDFFSTIFTNVVLGPAAEGAGNLLRGLFTGSPTPGHTGLDIQPGDFFRVAPNEYLSTTTARLEPASRVRGQAGAVDNSINITFAGPVDADRAVELIEESAILNRGYSDTYLASAPN